MSGAGNPRPPRVLRALLARILPPGRVQDGLVGDLDELFAERVERWGRARARAWYVRQFASAALHYPNPIWEELRDRATGFTALAAFSETSFNTADGGLVRRVLGQYVSGDYFALFGVRPALGRLLGPTDDVRGCHAVAVLGHGFWQSEYGGSPDVVGTTIRLSGKPFEIVGVAAPGFRGPVVGREIQVYATLGTRLVAGRDFDATDGPNGPKVAIVSESMATKFFGGGSPLGRQFRTKRGDTFQDPVTIVGVVEDAKYGSLREDESATIYLPVAQQMAGTAWLTLVLRAAGDPLSLVPAVRQVFEEVQPAATLEVTTLEAQLARSLQRERVMALLSTLFGSVALALTVLGLYGVMAYTVARRRNEIGVRIALDADAPRVVRMVLRNVVRVVVIGVMLGAAGAWIAGRLVRSFLYGLEPVEPSIMAGAAALLLASALAAGLRPALRAAGADPVAALREE